MTIPTPSPLAYLFGAWGVLFGSGVASVYIANRIRGGTIDLHNRRGATVIVVGALYSTAVFVVGGVATSGVTSFLSIIIAAIFVLVIAFLTQAVVGLVLSPLAYLAVSYTEPPEILQEDWR